MRLLRVQPADRQHQRLGVGDAQLGADGGPVGGRRGQRRREYRGQPDVLPAELPGALHQVAGDAQVHLGAAGHPALQQGQRAAPQTLGEHGVVPGDDQWYGARPGQAGDQAGA